MQKVENKYITMNELNRIRDISQIAKIAQRRFNAMGNKNKCRELEKISEETTNNESLALKREAIINAREDFAGTARVYVRLNRGSEEIKDPSFVPVIEGGQVVGSLSISLFSAVV